MISSSKKDLWNVLLLALFPATAVFLWDWLRWYVNNPDSFQYIQLAHHYSEGRWSEAVNGYWSPLIPWLLTPFIKSGIASVELFKILQLSIALVALFIWIKLIDLVRPRRAVGYIVKAAAIPLLLSHAFLAYSSLPPAFHPISGLERYTYGSYCRQHRSRSLFR
jgi:hypothetical protein